MKFSHATGKAVPLLHMPSGCKLRVEELVGSPALRSRLYSMGILPGTEMEVCGAACGKGAVCVRVRQCSLVLGEGMAEAIMCRRSDGHEPHRRHGHDGFGWWGGHPAAPCAQACSNEGMPCPHADERNNNSSVQ